jgi:hypothetical protein
MKEISVKNRVDVSKHIYLEGMYGPFGPEEKYLVDNWIFLNPKHDKYILVKNAIRIIPNDRRGDWFFWSMIFNVETGEMCGFLSDENETGELKINKSENNVWRIRN